VKVFEFQVHAIASSTLKSHLNTLRATIHASAQEMSCSPAVGVRPMEKPSATPRAVYSGACLERRSGITSW
jgi:hypothetical protein